MASNSEPVFGGTVDSTHQPVDPGGPTDLIDAEETLLRLAKVFLPNRTPDKPLTDSSSPKLQLEGHLLGSLHKWRRDYGRCVEQVPAVIFMAYLDRGVTEAYVNPQIEAALGFSQQEWLEDPVRWYAHIHPDDKNRWSVEKLRRCLFLENRCVRPIA